MRNSTQTWGLSTDPDVLLTVPKNSFQTIPERYNQPPVSLILPEVYSGLECQTPLTSLGELQKQFFYEA